MVMNMARSSVTKFNLRIPKYAAHAISVWNRVGVVIRFEVSVKSLPPVHLPPVEVVVNEGTEIRDATIDSPLQRRVIMKWSDDYSVEAHMIGEPWTCHRLTAREGDTVLLEFDAHEIRAMLDLSAIRLGFDRYFDAFPAQATATFDSALAAVSGILAKHHLE